MYEIWHRKKIEINADPQRRCYNGCHFSSELVWTEWGLMDYGLTKEKADARLEFWRSLNAYTVSQRGKSATAEYEVREVKEICDE